MFPSSSSSCLLWVDKQQLNKKWIKEKKNVVLLSPDLPSGMISHRLYVHRRRHLDSSRINLRQYYFVRPMRHDQANWGCKSCALQMFWLNYLLTYYRVYLLTPTIVMWVKRLAASLCMCVCVSVCLHGKTKTTETKITKLGMRIVHHESSPIN